MSRKIRLRFATALFVLALLFSPGGIGMGTVVLAACDPNAHFPEFKGFMYTTTRIGQPGGVALDKAATFLADMSDVKSAYFDQATNRIVFVGTKLAANQTPIFSKDDLAVAIRAVVFNNTIPTVNIGDPSQPANPNQPVQFTGGVENTNFGYVIEKADYSLKTYGLGFKPDGSKTTSAVGSYKSIYNRMSDLGYDPQTDTSSGAAGRLWITPKLITLKKDTSGNSFVFDQVQMQVQSETLTTAAPQFVQAAGAFAQDLTTNYDAYSQENVWFGKTKELSKIVGVVKWLKDNSIVTDYNWARNYKPAVVPTPTTEPFYQAGPVTFNGKQYSVYGGVSYTTPNTYASDTTGQSTAIKTVSQQAAPSAVADHWSYTYNSQTYQSVSVSADAFLAIGGYNTQTTDFNIDTQGDSPLKFTRSYGSLSSTTGDLGNGWDYLPARLTNPRSNIYIYCAPQGGFQGLYAWKLTFQSQEGALETFTYDCASGKYLPDRIDYNAVITRGTDGSYNVKLKDQTTYKFAGDVLTASHTLLSQSDRNSNMITYGYDTNGRLSSIKDAQNRKLTISRNAQGTIVAVSDWASRSVGYGYDSSGNLTSVTDPRGNIMRYGYDASGRLNRISDRQDRNVVFNTYDVNNRLSTSSGSTDLLSRYTYDEVNKVITVTDNNNRSTKSYYDARTRVVKQADALNNYVAFTYGEQPGPLTIRDKNGNTVTKTYDDWGNELTATYPNGGKVTNQYNGMHLVTNSSDSRYGTTPKVMSYTYDAKGNLLTQNNAGITASYTYDTIGNQLTATDGLSRKTTYTYDTFGHQLTRLDPVGATTTYAYDNLGRITKQTDAAAKAITYTYDKNSNVLTTNNGLGTTTQTYDVNNKLTRTTAPDGTATNFAYDAGGAQTSTRDALSALTSYGYDQYQNMTSRLDALNRTTTYAYDAMNRNTQTKTPLGKVSQWAYDAKGNVTKRIDASNRTTTYAYNSSDQLTKITYPDASTVTNTYDNRGNLTQSVSPAGTSAYTYDVYNRLTSEKNPANATVAYTYDAANNLTKVTYPDSKTVTYAYDAADRLKSVTDWNTQQTTYVYGANGTLTTKQLPNGILATYGYDAANRVNSLKYTNGQTILANYTYERDAKGSITKETETTAASTGAPEGLYSIYEDSLLASWNTTGSLNATVNTGDTPAYQGTKALSWQASFAFGYAQLQSSTPINTAPYTMLTFAAKASQAGQKFSVSLKDTNGAPLTKVDPTLYGGTLSATGYKVYNIPLSALGGANKQVQSIQFTNENSTAQPKVFIDNLRFTIGTPNAVVAYDDAYQGGFSSFNFNATLNPADTTAPYVGTNALGITFTNSFAYASTYNSAGVDSVGYQSVSFALKGSQANQNLSVQAASAGGSGMGVELPLSANGGYPSTTGYTVYNIPLTTLGISAGQKFYGLVLNNKTGAAQPKILLDELKLVPTPAGTQPTPTTGKVTTYGYDAVGRLKAASYPDGRSYTYAYDAVGNRTSSNENGSQSTYMYNSDNQLTAKGPRTFTYDNQGNQITDSSKTLTYDFDNRLKTLNGTALSFIYDGSGNRLSKTGGDTTHQFTNSTVSDLSKVLVDKNTTANTQNYLVYGDSLLSQGGAASTARQYYLTDTRGNVRYLTGNTGQTVQAYAYDPFGNEAAVSTASNYTFQGQEKDSESGLTYLRARYYDPTTGRFLSSDPLPGAMSMPDTQNGYSYASSDPINLSDPSGMIIDTLWDLGNTIYDMNNCNWGDAVFDGAAMFVPFLPAGGTKAVRALNNADDFAKQFKKISDGEIRKLQDAGFDVHDLKGKTNASHRDIFKDEKGNLYVKPKDGSGPGDPLYINIYDL